MWGRKPDKEPWIGFARELGFEVQPNTSPTVMRRVSSGKEIKIHRAGDPYQIQLVLPPGAIDFEIGTASSAPPTPGIEPFRRIKCGDTALQATLVVRLVPLASKLGPGKDLWVSLGRASELRNPVTNHRLGLMTYGVFLETTAWADKFALDRDLRLVQSVASVL